MSLKETFTQMEELLSNITADLDKSKKGNKAASQRVRTGTVKLEKVAKLFRKESIASEKKNKGTKKAPKASSGAPKGKASSHKSKGASHSKPKSTAVKAKPKAKTASKGSSFRPRELSIKRPTAKLPTKK